MKHPHSLVKKLIAAALFAAATPAAAQVIVPILPNNVPIVPPVWLPGAQVPYIPQPIRNPLPTGPVTFQTVALPALAAAPKISVKHPAAVANIAPAVAARIELPSPLRQAREKGLPVDAQLLTQVFDGVKAESSASQSPVDPFDNPELERAPERPQYDGNERRVTLPEWELEQDLGMR